MARIKIAYLGGGSTRAAGTMASFLHTGEDFDGSEVVLIDLNADRLDLDPRGSPSGWRRRAGSTSRSPPRPTGGRG